MKRLLHWALIAAMVSVAFAIGSRAGNDGDVAAQADRIASGLRCPVCQGLSVRDSDSPTAQDMRADIVRRLEEGQSADEVRRAYTDSYGEWVLLRPGTSGFAVLVWVIPAAVTGAAAVVLAAVMWHWHRRRRNRVPTVEDRRLVELAREREVVP